MTIHELPVPVGISLHMTTADFEYLYDTSMNWKDVDWLAQDGRFYPMPDYRIWERAYWFESRANFILARAFLEALQIDYSETVDGNTGDGVLLTNYGGAL